MSSRERTNESTKDLRIVSKWITFDSLAYIRESWRQPDLLKRKDSWSPQDVTVFNREIPKCERNLDLINNIPIRFIF